MTQVVPSIIPANEQQRMAAVRRYDVLDTPPDGAFDRITAMAARRFDVPIAIISIVDENRIWFKSHHGLPVEEIGRDSGLCASAILSPEVHIVLDASLDPRTLANPLVASDSGLRFYVGVPLQTSDGYNLGTLCVIDKIARTVSQDQIDDLKDLATVVMDQLELRLAARKSVGQAQLMAREIDHRVMNSLQFVSGILAMQSRTGGAQASEQLEMAANRVAAVARVHRHFHAEQAGTVSSLGFLRRLCAELSDILDRSIEVVGDEGMVSTNLVQPIGLIANELINNAAKHCAGAVRVSYRIRNGTHTLAVCDEGEGLPAAFDPEQGAGLGMKVIVALARQLGGKFAAEQNPVGVGSRLSVTFTPSDTLHSALEVSR